jgi:hypothetical protein
MTAMINLCIVFPIGWLGCLILFVFIFRVGFVPWQILMEEFIVNYRLEDQFFPVSLMRYAFHLFLCGPVIVECFRALPLILIFLVIPIQLYLRCYTLLGDFQVRGNALADVRKFRILFFKYDQFRVLNNESQPYIGLQVSFLLFAGIALSVLANFATIRAFHVFPWYVYWITPSLAIIILLIIQLLLPFGINVHTNSESLLRQWKSDPIHAKGKYLRRKLKSLRSLRWYAGLMGFYEYNFFMIQQSFKTAYYAVILGYTIDFIMLVPASALVGLKFSL